LTLCLIHKHPQVLLGMKKRGFGAGKWNGFGGKVQEGESIEEAARRELKEECGLDAKNMAKAGVISFKWQDKPEILEVHIFKAADFEGEPAESEEMRPQWFNANELPFEEMWPDDKHWMPLLLAGKKFQGSFLFDEKNYILGHQLNEVVNEI